MPVRAIPGRWICSQVPSDVPSHVPSHVPSEVPSDVMYLAMYLKAPGLQGGESSASAHFASSIQYCTCRCSYVVIKPRAVLGSGRLRAQWRTSSPLNGGWGPERGIVQRKRFVVVSCSSRMRHYWQKAGEVQFGRMRPRKDEDSRGLNSHNSTHLTSPHRTVHTSVHMYFVLGTK